MYATQGQKERLKRLGKRLMGEDIIELLWRCMAAPLESRNFPPARAFPSGRTTTIASAASESHRPAFITTSQLKQSLSVV
ncbi:hypothetical protein [Petrachloros mirabilis]